ncbi:MAG: hypothetical protein L3J09_10525 [Flavobacteriaceae bacterium]|nr:hypothetical protein [Flavobacteriaceae bacterium]
MKKLLSILLLVISVLSYSQDIRLFEHTWYLHDLVINGESNVPPINDEIPYVPADFFENGEIYTGMCEEGGAGQLEYFGTSEFDVLEMVFLLGGCRANSYFHFKK